MFYLEKCHYKDCTRTGVVALKDGDQVCNLHKNMAKTVEIKVENKKEEDEEK